MPDIRLPFTAPQPDVAIEKQRLAALARYNIVGTPDEKEFDDLVSLASFICGTPISLITLITEDKQWIKARVGVGITETDRSTSFCQYAILEDDVLEVPDMLEDIRFFSNPFVIGQPNVRFYAGAPLVTSDGHKLGTICVIDTVPRELTDHQRLALANLSDQVVALLELRLKR